MESQKRLGKKFTKNSHSMSPSPYTRLLLAIAYSSNLQIIVIQ
jgi:hypothetical protein